MKAGREGALRITCYAIVVLGVLPPAAAGAAPPANLSAQSPLVKSLTVGDRVILAQSRRQKQEQGAPAGGIAGRYALLREENKDSGCLLNLLAGGRAQLGPGCRDQGLVVFDPVAWSVGRNAIVLRARKGHRLNFVHKPDGIWLREPPDKRPLALRKY